jgi:hypothetical protein
MIKGFGEYEYLAELGKLMINELETRSLEAFHLLACNLRLVTCYLEAIS